MCKARDQMDRMAKIWADEVKEVDAAWTAALKEEHAHKKKEEVRLQAQSQPAQTPVTNVGNQVLAPSTTDGQENTTNLKTEESAMPTASTTTSVTTAATAVSDGPSIDTTTIDLLQTTPIVDVQQIRTELLQDIQQVKNESPASFLSSSSSSSSSSPSPRSTPLTPPLLRSLLSRHVGLIASSYFSRMSQRAVEGLVQCVEEKVRLLAQAAISGANGTKANGITARRARKRHHSAVATSSYTSTLSPDLLLTHSVELETYLRRVDRLAQDLSDHHEMKRQKLLREEEERQRLKREKEEAEKKAQLEKEKEKEEEMKRAAELERQKREQEEQEKKLLQEQQQQQQQQQSSHPSGGDHTHTLPSELVAPTDSSHPSIADHSRPHPHSDSHNSHHPHEEDSLRLPTLPLAIGGVDDLGHENDMFRMPSIGMMDVNGTGFPAIEDFHMNIGHIGDISMTDNH